MTPAGAFFKTNKSLIFSKYGRVCLKYAFSPTQREFLASPEAVLSKRCLGHSPRQAK